MMKWILTLALMSVILASCDSSNSQSDAGRNSQSNLDEQSDSETFDVLVFSKTAGYRHESIEKGKETIKSLSSKIGFTPTFTEDSSAFTTEYLNSFDVVIFLSTTMDVLGDPQQEAFKSFINNGGGYVGIHAAADTEYDWPWYNGLVGAYFESHPDQQNAEVVIVDPNHPSTQDLPEKQMRFDEWYNYKDMQRDKIKVLITLNEETYEGGNMNNDHPIAWYHEYDGGRAFYTGMGHTDASFEEEYFLKHLEGGILWVAGKEE